MWLWTCTRYSWVADEEQKKEVLGVYISNFEIYTRYSWVADEEQKKEFLGVLRGQLRL